MHINDVLSLKSFPRDSSHNMGTHEDHIICDFEAMVENISLYLSAFKFVREVANLMCTGND